MERYCALTRELDAAGEKFFADLGEDALFEDYEAAERAFVESSAGKLRELERVAPRKIREDARKLIVGMRQRAGLETAGELDEADAAAADERVRAYEKGNCEA